MKRRTGKAILLALTSWTVSSLGSAAELECRFERGWPIVCWQGKPLTRVLDTPALAVSVDDHAWPAGRVPDSGEPERATYRLPAGIIVDELQPFSGLPHCLVRTLRYENNADVRCDVTGATFRIAPLTTTSAPAWQAQSFAMLQLGERGPTLCMAFTSDEDTFHVQWKPGEAVEHHSNAAWRLSASESAAIGKQYIWVVDGDLEEARRTAQRWYDAVGLTVADDGPDWFRDCILYQASAGGSVDSRFGDVGGFENFAKQLDYIADLGCNAFWLMSVHTHKDPAHPLAGWNLYGPRRYDEVDPAYGGEVGLEALVAQMRERGFHILGEIVPHGGTAALPASHPAWWTYGRDGTRVNVFGQSPDYSHPEWQDAIGRSIEQLTAQFHFEGYRVDVAPGFGVNWHSSLNTPHVSRSTMGGAIGMLQAIRQGALAGGAERPAIIPESMETPQYARAGSIGYGFPLIRFLEQNPPAALSPAELNRRLRDFFERESGSLPRGMILLRTLNNHDTVVDHGRADRRFGVGLQRALTAVCTVVEGVPMIYQEQEVGSYEYFRHLFWARRRVPELRRGSADYLSIKAAPEIFTVLRSMDNLHAVGLVNLSSQTISTDVQLPSPLNLPVSATFAEVITGETVTANAGCFRWDFAPFATAIFRFSSEPLPAVPAERHHVVPANRENHPQFTWHNHAGDLQFAYGTVTGRIISHGGPVECTPLPDGSLRVTRNFDQSVPQDFTIQFDGVERWKVQSMTGDYADHLLRRHYPWPQGRFPWEPNQVWGREPHSLYHGVLPLGRVWQSAVAPLVDGGAICLAGAAGSGLVLRSAAHAGVNIVLADSAANPHLAADGMTLSFLSSDSALNPNWLRPWQSAGWLMKVPGDNQPQAARCDLVIGPFQDLAQDIPPLPLLPVPGWPEPSLGPGKHHFFEDRLWLEDPNTVVLPPVVIDQEGDLLAVGSTATQ